MKFQKLGKNFSKFYIYGTNLPYFEEEGVYRTCPDGIFIKSAVSKSKLPPKKHELFNPCSPYDLAILYNTLSEIHGKDTHAEDAPPGTVYYK